MAAVKKLDIKNHLLSGAVALGNTKKSLINVASDLVNQHGLDKKNRGAIMDGTFLSLPTLERLASLKDCESGEAYRPQLDTVERVLKYFDTEITLNQVAIRRAYGNKAKETHE